MFTVILAAQPASSAPLHTPMHNAKSSYSQCDGQKFTVRLETTGVQPLCKGDTYLDKNATHTSLSIVYTRDTMHPIIFRIPCTLTFRELSDEA